MEYRDQVRATDVGAVREILASTGFFYPAEIEVALELVADRLARGGQSDYSFVFAEEDGAVAGYTCYGPIACTLGSYDLYWIAVRQRAQRGGLGRRLLAETEARIRQRGGRRVYIETSGRPLYEPTRRFYERCGYRLEAQLEDFYAPGDPKLIYGRVLDAEA